MINSYMFNSYFHSFMHFVKSKDIDYKGAKLKIYVYLLDKRFITTSNIDIIKNFYLFKRCKVKDDTCFYIIYSANEFNFYEIFNVLLNSNLLVPIDNFFFFF